MNSSEVIQIIWPQYLLTLIARYTHDNDDDKRPESCFGVLRFHGLNTMLKRVVYGEVVILVFYIITIKYINIRTQFAGRLRCRLRHGFVNQKATTTMTTASRRDSYYNNGAEQLLFLRFMTNYKNKIIAHTYNIV